MRDAALTEEIDERRTLEHDLSRSKAGAWPFTTR